MKFIAVIDQINGSLLTLETFDGKVMIVERSEIPFEVCEGDIVVFKNNHYFKDEQKRKEIESKNKDIMDGLSDDK